MFLFGLLLFRSEIDLLVIIVLGALFTMMVLPETKFT